MTAAVLVLTALAAVSVLLPGCGGAKDDGWPSDKTGPKVVVSFAPLYSFAVNVAGDDAVVRNMLTTSGPHSFQPTDKEALLLSRADLFFINGLGLEGNKPEMLKNSSGNPNLKVVDLGSRIPKDQLLMGSCNHGDADHVDHEHGMDAHVWLSPDYAVMQVEGIRDALKEADPAHAANYDRRAAEYIAKLQNLKADGVAAFKDKKDRNLVTFHDSMTYFAKTFDLNIVGVVQKNPGTEPNDQHLKELIGLCADEKKPIRVITVEPQFGSSRSAHQVVEELRNQKVPDPRLVEFDPLETALQKDLTTGWYEARMRANIEALAKAMR